MRWAHRQAALVELELLVFTVGGFRLAAPLEQVAGVLSDISLLEDGGDRGSIPFQGVEIPLLRPENVFSPGIRGASQPGAVILFRTRGGTCGVGVDAAHDVLRITPGDRLYRLLPRTSGGACPPGPWGFVELGDLPIMLVDFGPVQVH